MCGAMFEVPRLLLLFVVFVLKASAVHKLGVGLQLWIDENQVKSFGGFNDVISVIEEDEVLNYLRDPNFEDHLPMIPSEVNQINFTWTANKKKYFYNFDILRTLDETVLDSPKISIKTEGRIPKKPKGPDPECDKSCANGGWCNNDRVCICINGYIGQYCTSSLCFPQCQNGGNCTAPGVCSCPDGFQGPHCEGGICRKRCLNGGKCIQKDTCKCPSGYFGHRCELSKCVVPCLNGGKCKDKNKCKCPEGFSGDHCEILSYRTCKKPCKHGSCHNGACVCDSGWAGRWCHRSLRDLEARMALMNHHRALDLFLGGLKSIENRNGGRHDNT